MHCWGLSHEGCRYVLYVSMMTCSRNHESWTRMIWAHITSSVNQLYHLPYQITIDKFLTMNEMQLWAINSTFLVYLMHLSVCWRALMFVWIHFDWWWITYPSDIYPQSLAPENHFNNRTSVLNQFRGPETATQRCAWMPYNKKSIPKNKGLENGTHNINNGAVQAV